MKTKLLLVFCIIAILMTACRKEVPMEVQISTEQLTIEGKTAHVIHADTTNIVLHRDSSAKENSEFYTIHTSITLVLDSIYPTDKMEDSLTLKLQSADGQILATLLPIDSLLVESLIDYLQTEVGRTKEMVFEGEMDGMSILKLQEGAKVSLSGFSFLFADPTISKELDEYRKALDSLKQITMEAQQATSQDPLSGLFYAIAIGQVVKQINGFDKKLQQKKSKMTPYQLTRYDLYHGELQSYDMK